MMSFKPLVQCLAGVFMVGCQHQLTTSTTPASLPEGMRLVEQHTPKAEQHLQPAFSKYKLSNGLTVLLVPDSDIQSVTVGVTYKVGSNIEQPGYTGFAHLFEHMMFEGSAHVKGNQHTRMVHDMGGTSNANTTATRTFYYNHILLII